MVSSVKGNFKLKRNSDNNKMIIVKANKILTSLNIKLKNKALEIELSSIAITATVTEWYDLYPSVFKQYPMSEYVYTSRHTITQLIRHSYQEKINLLVLATDLIINIYSYLFPQNNYTVKVKEFVNGIKLNDKYNRALHDVFLNQDCDFNH